MEGLGWPGLGGLLELGLGWAGLWGWGWWVEGLGGGAGAGLGLGPAEAGAGLGLVGWLGVGWGGPPETEIGLFENDNIVSRPKT